DRRVRTLKRTATSANVIREKLNNPNIKNKTNSLHILFRLFKLKNFGDTIKNETRFLRMEKVKKKKLSGSEKKNQTKKNDLFFNKIPKIILTGNILYIVNPRPLQIIF
ncbi:hypothetical protein C7U77_18560, partial [Escherichia coli]|uniref:hypothetical protein n=1 Tax=Escherichia coli TaxID=562 RepID=UPI000D4DD7F8